MEEGGTAALDEPTVDVAQAVDIIWVFFSLVLVTLMQPGFACYEVGAISATTSIRPILLKNIGDASVSLVAWFACGFAFASGDDLGHFVGKSFFFFTGDPFEETPEHSAAMAFLGCLYQWSFAAACTTIISGAVADRIPFKAYIIYAFLTSAVFYPILAHWVWADEGWASASRDDPLFGCGVIDFAGSGVVHMCGGGIALIIASTVEPRKDRFFSGTNANTRKSCCKAFKDKCFFWAKKADVDDSTQSSTELLLNNTDLPQINEADFSQNDMAWMTLGGFLLWIGWYGFNCGSTLQISTVESQTTAGRAAVNTTIGAAFGCLFSMVVEVAYHLQSPSYRHPKDEDAIEDPLHKASEAWDTNLVDNLNGEALHERAMITEEDRDATLTKIREHRKVHKEQGSWLRSVTWPDSTHINRHGAAVNGILAGLVGITAGCATMSFWSAVWVSCVSALLYHVSYRAIIRLSIDDAVGAGAIHFVCGAWGLIAAGLTATEAARLDAGYPSKDTCSWRSQAGANSFMALIIFLYAPVCAAVIFIPFACLGWTEDAVQGEENPRLEDKNFTALKKSVTEHYHEHSTVVLKLEAHLNIKFKDIELLRGSGEENVPDEGEKDEG